MERRLADWLAWAGRGILGVGRACLLMRQGTQVTGQASRFIFTKAIEWLPVLYHPIHQ